MDHSLKHEYPSVQRGALVSYGGSQMWADSKTEQKVGCGLVAALDLLLYLDRFHEGKPYDGPVAELSRCSPLPLSDYNTLIRHLRTHYLPLIPGHGINGLFLSAGLNAYFVKHHMPYRSRWGVSYARLWRTIDRMLEDDIPVILSVGPNFPLFWQKYKLRFYTRLSREVVTPGPETHAHYVAVTASDEQNLQISSWGRKYYIRKDEYLSYVKEHSLNLVSNILYVERKDRGV